MMTQFFFGNTGLVALKIQGYGYNVIINFYNQNNQPKGRTLAARHLFCPEPHFIQITPQADMLFFVKIIKHRRDRVRQAPVFPGIPL